MLCYVMLCYVMLCYVMLCYVMLCYVMLCYVILYILISVYNENIRKNIHSLRKIPSFYVLKMWYIMLPFFCKELKKVKKNQHKDYVTFIVEANKITVSKEAAGPPKCGYLSTSRTKSFSI